MSSSSPADSADFHPNTPELLESARAAFGTSYDRALAYAELLAGPAVERGLIGPRETDRLWSRHLLNSVVAEELIPAGSRVVDIGSGAGLPGLPIALARPDLRVVLLDSMLRRCAFLTEAVAVLGLGDRVEVVRGRAPEVVRAGLEPVDVAVSRAVAPLGPLTLWTVPLLCTGGVMLALRGAGAVEEVREAADVLSRAAVDRVEVVRCGSDRLSEPTLVVRAFRIPSRRPEPARRHRTGGKGDRRRRGSGHPRST